MALLTLAGCATGPLHDQVIGASYRPSNIHTGEATLPASFRRLAVLPLTSAGEQSEMEFGRETLWPVLLDELGRVKQFEIVPVSPEQLRSWTGRSSWTGDEKFPLEFFETLREAADADGVLFCRLTQYRAYEPLALGWRTKLLDLDTFQILWAVDEVFDARRPEVANAARRFAKANPDVPGGGGDSHRILSSPRRFARYTASEVFRLLPAR